MTAKKAVDGVVGLGLLARIPSVSTFVKSPSSQISLLEIKNFADGILSRDRTSPSLKDKLRYSWIAKF